jgi:phosphoribosylformimino-5-aminoimidazole carboxamide ribotide isomerase
MYLLPAIDLRHGRVVRLQQGEAGRETRYHDDPLAQAEAFIAAGAQWLHVVDLDRAFGTGDNLAMIGRIARMADGRVRVQVGGGIRTLDALRAVRDLGIARAVLGTALVRDPELVPAAVRLAGAEGIAAGLDVKDGHIAIRGWVETTGVLAREVAVRVRAEGVATVVYTDVGRDGMLSGPDLPGARALKGLGLEVILSGGVSSLEDLKAASAAGLAGVIVGRALYEGRFSLGEALEAVAS